MNEPGRARQIARARVSEPGSGPEPEGELEGLKVSLRAIFRASKVRLAVTLGPDLRARASRNSLSLKTLIFLGMYEAPVRPAQARTPDTSP